MIFVRLLFAAVSLIGQQALPIASNHYPFDGATDIALNTSILHPGVADPFYRTAMRDASGPVALELANAGSWLRLKPSRPLTANTRYIVEITSTIPANPSHTFSFTTGTRTDTEGPRFVSISPEPNSTLAGHSDPIRILYSEPIIFHGVGEVRTAMPPDSTFPSLGAFAPAFYSISEDRREVRIRPPAGSRVIDITVGPAMDTAGNLGTGETRQFRIFRGYSPETVFPVVSGTYPADGAESVAPNSPVQILFSRPMQTWAMFGTPAGAAVRVTANGRPISVRFERFAGGRGLLVAPFEEAWPLNAAMEIHVDAALHDTAGVPMRSPLTLRWRTSGELLPRTAPVIEASVPPQPTPFLPIGVSPNNTQLEIRTPYPWPEIVALYAGDLAPDASSKPPTFAVRLSQDRRTLVLSPNAPMLSGLDSRSLPSLRDLLGREVPWMSPLVTSFSAESPPTLAGTTPVDGEPLTPIAIEPGIRMSLPPSLDQPANVLRLFVGEDPVEGQVVVEREVIRFRPRQPLAPETEYRLEYGTVRTIVGSVIEPGSFRFKTARAFLAPWPNGPPRYIPEPGQRDLAPDEVIRLNWSRPGGGADMVCSAAAPGPVPSNPPSARTIPIRLSWEGQTLLIAPTEGWPAVSTFGITCRGADLLNQQMAANAVYTARTTESHESARLVSANPPSGSILPQRSRVVLTFSRPVIDLTEYGRGLVWIGANQIGPAEAEWSSDHRTAVVGVPFSSETYTLAPSEDLTDLLGTPVPPFTYTYSLSSPRLPKPFLQQILPAPGNEFVDPSATITAVMSGPVPIEDIRRSIAVLDVNSGRRIDGRWEFDAASGVMLTFRPDRPFPFEAEIRLVDYEELFSTSVESFGFRVAPAPPAATALFQSAVVRVTTGTIPANGVIDIEFSREIPFRPDFVRLDYSTPNGPRFEQPVLSQPRPRVVRLTPAPGSKWTPAGNHRIIINRAFASNWFSNSELAYANLNVGPEETTTRPNLISLSPIPDSTNVPVSAGISVLFEDQINPLTLGEDSVRIRANGAAIPHTARLSFTHYGVRVTFPVALPNNALIDVEVRGLEDRFGRAFAPQRWSFRTGDAVDISSPVVLSNPIYRADNSQSPLIINPTQPVRIEYDEPIDPLSVRSRAGQDLRLSSDHRTLTIRPVPEWPRGRPAAIDFAVSDLSGNNLGEPLSVTFSAVFEDDSTPPVLLAQSFPDGETGVPLNPHFSLRFDSTVDHGSFRKFKLLRGITEVPLRSLSRAFALGNVLRFAPAVLLDPNAEYVLVIEGVSDPSGNVMAGTRRWTFTTGARVDVAAPLLTSSPPPTAAPGTPRFRWRFSEPLDAMIATPDRLIEGPDPGTNGNFFRLMRARFEMSADRMEIEIIPEEPLEEARRYTITLPLLFDRAGNSLTQGSVIRLTVIPARSEPVPFVVSFFPPNGTTDFPRNGIATVISSSAVASHTLRVLEDGKPVSIVVNPATRGITHPERLWTAGATYQVEVPALRDVNGNESAPFVSTFTVGPSADSSAVRFQSADPPTGARNVRPDAPVRAVFDKLLFPTNPLGEAIRFTDANGLPINTGPQRVDGASIVATPAPYWPPASSVTGTINRLTEGGASIRSWTGASVDFLAVSFQFFTAALADSIRPTIESVSSPPGSVLPAAETFVNIRFSEPVVIPLDGFRVTVDGRQVGGCFLSSSDFRSCRIQLQPPPKVSIAIAGTSAIKDYAGNSIEPFVYEYTSSEAITSGPIRMVRTEPARASTVAPDALPLVEFDRAMDLSNVSAGFRVLRNNALVPGSVEELNAGRVFRFRPSEPFPAGSRILVILDRDVIRDSKGWGIYEETYFEFNVSGSASPLTIRRSNAAQGVQSSDPIEVEFENPLDRESVNSNSVWLTLDGRAVEGAVSLRGEHAVRFEPASPLFVGQRYLLTLGSALRGRAGERWTGGYSISFEAEADAELTVAAMTPTRWNGAPAILVRLSGRTSAVDAVEFEAEGAETILAADGRSVIVVTRDAAAIRLRGQPVRPGTKLYHRIR